MKNKIYITVILILAFVTITKASTTDNKLAQLQEIIAESKLLPTPAGVGGAHAQFGESVAIDGNRALVGSPRALEHGVAYIYDFDSNTNIWVETQLVFPDDINAENRFGKAVSLQGDRALIADPFNRVLGQHQAGAVYVYELTNGVWELTQKLIASDRGSTDEFGISVSLSGDRVLIGADNYDDATNGSGSGAAYIFDYDGSDWQETIILTATNGSSGDGFGNAVSLDGDQALIGTSNYDDNNNTINTGSAYLFELSGGTWSESHQFLASDGADNDKYGIAVGISAGRVLIGASDTDENFQTSGSAYVYELDGLLWIETKLLAPDAATIDRFGVAVSIENNRLLVGARAGEELGSSTGSAYIFDYDTGQNDWGFTEEISADDITSSGFFASSLGLSGDKIIAGNFRDPRDGNNTGAAYVFDLGPNINDSWQQSQKIIAQGAVEDNFGYAISLDGNRALIGAPFDDDNGPDSGAVYIFDFVNGQWSTPLKLMASDVNLNFGSAVDLDNNTAIIAANRINFSGSGTVYIYNFNGSVWVETALLNSAPGQNDGFGFSVSLSGDKAVVGSSQRNGNSIRSGATYVYELNQNTGIWEETHQLIITDGETDDGFGSSASILGDRILVGASSEDDGFSRSGAAYIFDYDVNTDEWLETKLQIPNSFSNSFVGTSVDLGNDRAVIGASNGRGANNSPTGTAYIFDYDSNANLWSGVKLFASDGGGLDQFGVSVSLDNDKVLIGARLDDDIDTNAGAVYQFNYDGSTWNQTKKYTPSDGARDDFYGWSVSLSGDNAIIGSYKDDDGGTDSGSVYTFNVEFVFGDGFE